MKNMMIPLIQPFKTVVLANGAFPAHEIPRSFLRNAEHVICCDGATKNLLAMGIEPDFIIGDMDSISEDLKRRFESILIHISEQENNDLTKAVNFCCVHDWDCITILGATGKRDDHTLGNISLLANYAIAIKVQMLTDYGVFVPQLLQPKATYESYIGQQVSLFSLHTDTLFTTKNLAYPLENRALTTWWQGSLNEATADNFTIEMDTGKALIFREYEQLITHKS
ncbi:thiamin pyrophosphokinase [Candidatus Symbiothrix dinenymphae]|nr:thiamin pyrophosphokinase [Candidatus Symbiothrix dinenymphae]